EMVNVPIQERRISRYHCRINEEGDQFRLWDEGSTSGTYVNDEEVGHTGRILMHGDIIEIGPVKYRFEQARDGKHADDDTVFGDSKIFDQTEIYVRRADGDR
ncbi:MAG: FHA domain-containing protein, partial [Caldilineaceae bacterium]|nr:FHA domain-containing protein [Caldilineaceae bacterium]